MRVLPEDYFSFFPFFLSLRGHQSRARTKITTGVALEFPKRFLKFLKICSNAAQKKR